MLLLAGLLWRVLAFGTLVLPAAALRFNFTDVQQCDQVMISFAGSNLRNDSVPSSLSILPVNSTAILVPLPDPGIINTGVALTFLPFAAGTNFVASLDDSTGENLIFVSDLIRVLPSESGNSSCLPNANPNQQKLFALTSPVSQCENITVTYNTTLTTKPPIVRLYNPKGRSFRLNQTSDDRASGTATYLMNFFRGRGIILLMDDGDGVRETTPLLTVGGDSASDASCIQRNFTFGFLPNNTGGSDATPVASKAVIIGGATGGGAVLLVGVCMVIFILRDRRRRRTKQLDTSQEEKGLETNENDKNGGAPVINVSDTSQGQDQEGQNRSTNLVANPIYTRNPSLLQSPPRSIQERGSMASWLQAIPDDQRYSAPLASPSPDMSSGPSRTRSVDNLSLQSLDIEGMLNMATLQSESYSRKNSAVGSATPSPVVLGRSPLASIARDAETGAVVGPPSAYLRAQTSRRHLRGPSDVPAGPDSMAFSGYSVNVNPFDGGRNSMAASILNSPTTQYSSAPSPRGTRPPVGLPKSPRDSVRDRTISATSSEWYGIAR